MNPEESVQSVIRLRREQRHVLVRRGVGLVFTACQNAIVVGCAQIQVRSAVSPMTERSVHGDSVASGSLMNAQVLLNEVVGGLRYSAAS
jgi:hypothetical protein